MVRALEFKIVSKLLILLPENTANWFWDSHQLCDTYFLLLKYWETLTKIRSAGMFSIQIGD